MEGKNRGESVLSSFFFVTTGKSFGGRSIDFRIDFTALDLPLPFTAVGDVCVVWVLPVDNVFTSCGESEIEATLMILKTLQCECHQPCLSENMVFTLMSVSASSTLNSCKVLKCSTNSNSSNKSIFATSKSVSFILHSIWPHPLKFVRVFMMAPL